MRAVLTLLLVVFSMRHFVHGGGEPGPGPQAKGPHAEDMEAEVDSTSKESNVTESSPSSSHNNVFTTVVWTSEKDSSPSTTTTKKKAAFRDLVFEKTGQKLFENFMAKARRKESQESQMLRDPMHLKDTVNLRRTLPMLNFSLLADHMVIHGLHRLNLTYLRVIRHMGLRDIKLNLRIGADISIEGKYMLDGQALGFIPVSGDGDFKIDISGFSLLAIASLVLEEDQAKLEDKLMMRELEVTMDYKDVRFDFKNLMGGGALGQAANMIINTVGEVIIDSQKINIVKMMKTRFREEVSRFL